MKPQPSPSRRHLLSRLGLAMAGLVGLPVSAAAAPGAAAASRNGPRPPFRRVVTGVDAAGHSIIVSDGPVPTAAQWSFSHRDLVESPYLRGITGNEIWLLDAIPADTTQARDPLLGTLPDGDQPAPGGLIARIHRFEAGTVYPMHRTQTVDLIVIVSGRMEVTLERGAATVGPGDVIVQNGTQHGWRVVGDEACVFVAVLIDAVRSQSANPSAS